MSEVMSWDDYYSLDHAVIRHVRGKVEALAMPGRIAITLNLLRSEHSDALLVLGDGDLVIICGEYHYRATDRVTPHGDPEYRLERRVLASG